MTLKEIEMTMSISNGNRKTGKGVANVSTLPGDKNHLLTKKDGTILSDVPGTCGGMCAQCYQYCYAKNAAKRYPSAHRAWAKNTVLLRKDPKKFFSLIDAYLNTKKGITDFRSPKAEQEALSMLPHCRAVGSNHKETGVQCVRCNVYYRRKGLITVVYSH